MSGSTRGICSGCRGGCFAGSAAYTEEDALRQVQTLLAQGYSLKEATKQVSAALGIAKNQLYALALQEKEKGRTV